MNLDRIDKQILALLQEQGRMTNTELANRVGLAAASVLERVKKLERNEVITGYHASLDADAVGIGMTVMVEVTLARHRQEAVRDFIQAAAETPQIMELYHVTGRADFLLKVVAGDIAAYENFVLETLSALPGIQHIETMVVLSVVKQAAVLPQLKES